MATPENRVTAPARLLVKSHFRYMLNDRIIIQRLGSQTMQLKVNGKIHQVDVEPDMPL